MIDFQNLFNGVFKDKTVFVTGHTGFQGTWISLLLNRLGSNVIGFSKNIPTNPSFYEMTNLKNSIIDIVGDITNLTHLQESIKKHDPDIILHFAAQSIVRTSYSSPLETFQSNVMGTANILDCLRENNVKTKVCVIVTSDKCYENKEWDFSYRENDQLGGTDPYSASKGAAEIITSSYRSSFFNSNTQKPKTVISTVRAGNVIGGGDWATDRIIPDCVRSITSGKKIFLRNPTSIRPWQYVLEPILGMLILSEKMFSKPLDYEGPWNFGPNNSNSSISVKLLVEQLIKNWGMGSYDIKSNYEPHEAHTLRLDSTKSNTKLNWKPTYSLHETIIDTVSWYKNFYQKNNNIEEFSNILLDKFLTKAQSMNII